MREARASGLKSEIANAKEVAAVKCHYECRINVLFFVVELCRASSLRLFHIRPLTILYQVVYLVIQSV